MENIVITGMGFVTPLGTEPEAIINALNSGESGIKQRELETLKGEKVTVWNGEISEFDATKYILKKKLRRMDNVNKFAINACGDALADANIQGEMLENCGVMVGTGYSGLSSVAKHNQKLHAQGIEALTPIHFPTTVYNATAGMAAIEHKLGAVNSTITGMDLCGEYALLYATMLLQQGQADYVVVIGADELSAPQQIGLKRLGRLSENGDYAPFSDGNTGLTMGEGAVALVLEKESTAKARDAHCYATIAGLGQFNSSDSQFSYGHSTQGIKVAIDHALTQAATDSTQIKAINTSANGDQQLNALEANLVHELFPDNQIPVWALNSAIGSYPGAGIARMAMAILLAKESSQSQAELAKDSSYDMASYLNSPANSQGKNLLHIANGVGGAAVAITLQVA